MNPDAGSLAMAAVSGSEPTPRSVFIAWEKLRIAYNAILVTLVLFMLFTSPRTWDPGRPPAWASTEAGRLNWPLVLLQCAAWGVASNVGYFLGPAAEAYAAWLGWRSAMLRYGLFLLGTLFTAIAAVITVMQQLGLAQGFD